MQTTSDYFERLIHKLDEWHHELTALEMQARLNGGDARAQAELHKLELQEMFVDIQNRIEGLRQGLGGHVADRHGQSRPPTQAAWQRLTHDLEDMNNHLFPGN